MAFDIDQYFANRASPDTSKVSTEKTDEILAKVQQASASKIANLKADMLVHHIASIEQADPLQTAGDVGIKLLQGGVDLGQSVVGLGSLATGGMVGKGFRAIGYDPERLNAMLGEHLSKSQQASDQKVSDAKGFLGTIEASLRNPRSILGGVAESTPAMLAGMGVSGSVARGIAGRAAMVATGLGEEAALASQVGRAAAQKAIEESSTKLLALGSGVEGAQTAGQIADQAQAAGRDYSDYVLPSLAAGAGTAAIGMVSNKIFGDAATDLATGTHTLKGGKLAKLAKEGFSEGVTEELPQSAQEQYFTNIAMGEPDHMKGVAEAAGQGLVTGAAMGIGLGSLHGGEHAHKGTADTATTPEAKKQYADSVAANDVSPYLDKKDPAYDPSKAVSVLLAHAQHPDTAPEVKQANLKQAGDIVYKLEEYHAKMQDEVDSHSPAEVKAAQTQLAAKQAELANTDPADTAKVTAINEHITDLSGFITDMSDSKQAALAKAELSKTARQLNDSRTKLDALTTVAEPSSSQADVNSLIAEVDTPASVRVDSAATSSADASTAAERLINLSMTQPDAMTSEQALKLADNKNNTLTPEQRDHLRAFSEARITENTLSSQGKVSQEVLYGSKENVGITQYRTRIASAIASNTPDIAQRQLGLLSKFAADHQEKALVAREAMRSGMGSQIIKTATGWAMQPRDEKLTDAQIRKNGGLTLNSPKLVTGITSEAKALNAAVKEMTSATNLKFGVQSGSASKTTSDTPASPASLFREKREREGRVEEDKSSSPEKTPIPVSKLEQGRQRNEKQEAAVNAAKAEIAKRAAAKAGKPADAEVQSVDQEQAKNTEDIPADHPAWDTEVTTNVWVKSKNAYREVALPANEVLASVRSNIKNLEDMLGCMKG